MKNLLLAALAVATTAVAMPFSNRITLPSGEQIFLSGYNLAWINFGRDVGDVPLDTTRFRSAMRNVADSGGNTMRIWLSTNGSFDPVFGADGYVSGLGSHTIRNVQTMLRIAREENMLLMPVLLSQNFMQSQQYRVNIPNNRRMLTTDSGLSAYIQRAVIPLVTAIGNDPNLVCWEICNECEGMVQGVGWTTERITQTDVQRLTNRIAGAIHRAVPGVLVSTGTVTANLLHWYSDNALRTVGGDQDGIMDFYQIHYYGWNGTQNSPFRRSAAAWNLDKPIVVGEFPSSSWSPATNSSSRMQDTENIDTLLLNLFNNGYAGGLFWQYQPDGGDTWLRGFETSAPSMAALYRLHPNDIRFDGQSDGRFSLVVGAAGGGSVQVSPTGRVLPGTVVTVTPVAAPGFEFTGWTGDTTGIDSPLVITVRRDRSFTAQFRPGAGTNLLDNGDFAAGMTGWGQWVNTASGNTATLGVTAGEFRVSISATDTVNYGIQLSQSGLSVEAGRSYRLTFDAWSNGNRPLNIGLKHDGSVSGNWNKNYGFNDVSLTATRRTFEADFTVDSTEETAVLQFNLGSSTLPVHLDNISLVVLPTLSADPRSTQHRGLTVVRRAGEVAWTLDRPAPMGTRVRVLDGSGRVLADQAVNAGSTSGTIAADRSSISVLLLTGPALHAAQILPPAR